MKKDKESQLQFDFVQNEKTVGFEKINAKCKCGYQVEVKKAIIVIEMTLICPQCKAVIIV